MVQVGIPEEGGLAKKSNPEGAGFTVDGDGPEPSGDGAGHGPDGLDGPGLVQILETGIHKACGVADVAFPGPCLPGQLFDGVHGVDLEEGAGGTAEEVAHGGVEMPDQGRLDAVVAEPEDEQVESAVLEDFLL